MWSSDLAVASDSGTMGVDGDRGAVAKTELKDTALQLPPEERLELVEALWESLDQESIPVASWQKRILDERIAADDAAPDSGSSWPEVRERIEKDL